MYPPRSDPHLCFTATTCDGCPEWSVRDVTVKQMPQEAARLECGEMNRNGDTEKSPRRPVLHNTKTGKCSGRSGSAYDSQCDSSGSAPPLCVSTGPENGQKSSRARRLARDPSACASWLADWHDSEKDKIVATLLWLEWAATVRRLIGAERPSFANSSNPVTSTTGNAAHGILTETSSGVSPTCWHNVQRYYAKEAEPVGTSTSQIGHVSQSGASTKLLRFSPCRNKPANGDGRAVDPQQLNTLWDRARAGDRSAVWGVSVTLHALLESSLAHLAAALVAQALPAAFLVDERSAHSQYGMVDKELVSEQQMQGEEKEQQQQYPCRTICGQLPRANHAASMVSPGAENNGHTPEFVSLKREQTAALRFCWLRLRKKYKQRSRTNASVPSLIQSLHGTHRPPKVCNATGRKLQAELPQCQKHKVQQHGRGLSQQAPQQQGKTVSRAKPDSVTNVDRQEESDSQCRNCSAEGDITATMLATLAARGSIGKASTNRVTDNAALKQASTATFLATASNKCSRTVDARSILAVAATSPTLAGGRGGRRSKRGPPRPEKLVWTLPLPRCFSQSKEEQVFPSRISRNDALPKGSDVRDARTDGDHNQPSFLLPPIFGFTVVPDPLLLPACCHSLLRRVGDLPSLSLQQLAFCDALVALLFLVAATERCLPSPNRCRPVQRENATQRRRLGVAKTRNKSAEAVIGETTTSGAAPGLATQPTAATGGERPKAFINLKCTCRASSDLEGVSMTEAEWTPSTSALNVEAGLSAVALLATAETVTDGAPDEATMSKLVVSTHTRTTSLDAQREDGSTKSAQSRKTDNLAEPGSNTRTLEDPLSNSNNKCKQPEFVSRLLLLWLQLLFAPGGKCSTTELEATIADVLPPVDKELISSAPFFAFLLVLLSLNPPREVERREDDVTRVVLPVQSEMERKEPDTRKKPARPYNQSHKSYPFSAAQTASTERLPADTAGSELTYATSSAADTMIRATPRSPASFQSVAGSSACCSVGFSSVSPEQRYCAAPAGPPANLPEANVKPAAPNPCRLRVGASSHIQGGFSSFDAVAFDGADTYLSFRRKPATAASPRAAGGRSHQPTTHKSVSHPARGYYCNVCCGASGSCANVCHSPCCRAELYSSCTNLSSCIDSCHCASLRPRESRGQSEDGSGCFPAWLGMSGSLTGAVGEDNTSGPTPASDVSAARTGTSVKRPSAKPQHHKVASKRNHWPTQQHDHDDSHAQRQGFDSGWEPDIPFKCDSSTSRTPSPGIFSERINAKTGPVPAFSSAEIARTSRTAASGSRSDGTDSLRGSNTCYTCGGFKRMNMDAFLSQDVATCIPWEAASGSTCVLACPASLSTDADAVWTLTLIIEHISHHILVQPLLFVLLPPVLHLLLQILSRLVQLHCRPPQYRPTSAVRLLSVDVLTLLSRESEQLLVILQRDISCCRCSRYILEMNGREPPQAYVPKEHPHHQHQRTLQQQERILPYSKRVTSQSPRPHQKMQDDNGSQRQDPPHQAGKQQQAQQQRRGRHRQRPLSYFDPLSRFHSRNVERTASSAGACCRDLPTTTQCCIRHSCGCLSCCGICGGLVGGYHQGRSTVRARTLESITFRDGSNSEINTSCKLWGRRGRSADIAPTSVSGKSSVSLLMTGSGSSSDYRLCASQCRNCRGATKTRLNDALLTPSQRASLEADLRRLLHLVEAAKHSEIGQLEQLNGEQFKVCCPVPSESAANAVCGRQSKRVRSAVTGPFSHFSAGKTSAGEACGEVLTEGTSWDPQESWSIRPLPQTQVLSGVQGTPVLILLQEGALLPLHPHTLLAFALRQRGRQRHVHSRAHPARAASISVAKQQDWLDTGEAKSAGVSHRGAGSVDFREFLPAASCGSPPTAGLGDDVGPASAAAAAGPTGIPVPDDTNHGALWQQTPVSPDKSSWFPPDVCHSLRSSRYEHCEQSGIERWARETEQKAEKNPLQTIGLHGEPVLCRIRRRLRREENFIAFPQRAPTNPVLRGSQSLISGSKTVDGLLSCTEQAVPTTLQADMKYNLPPSEHGAVYSVGEMNLNKHCKGSSLLKADVSAAPSLSPTAPEGPSRVLAIATFSRDTQKEAQMTMDQGSSPAGLLMTGEASTTLQFRVSANTAAASKDEETRGPTMRSKMHGSARLEESMFPTSDIDSNGVGQRLQEVSNHVGGVVGNGASQTRSQGISLWVRNSPTLAGGAVDSSRIRRVTAKQSASGELRSNAFATPSQHSPGKLRRASAFRSARGVKTDRPRSTTFCDDIQTPLAAQSRCAVVSVSSGTACHPPWQALLSLLRVKKRCSKRCSTSTRSTKGSLGKRNRSNATTTRSSSHLSSTNGTVEFPPLGDGAANELGKHGDTQTMYLKKASTRTTEPEQPVPSFNVNAHEIEASALPVLPYTYLGEEVELQQKLDRWTLTAKQELTAVTPDVSPLSAAAPLALSNFSAPTILCKEAETCMIKNLPPATDADELAVGQTKDKKVLRCPVSSRWQYSRRVHSSVQALPIAPDHCKREEFANKPYTAADRLRKHNNASASTNIPWQSDAGSAARNSHNRVCCAAGHRCTSRGTLHIWTTPSRDNSPPLFFSQPEVIYTLHNSEVSSVASGVEHYRELKKTMGDAWVDKKLNIDNFYQAPPARSRAHHEAEAPSRRQTRRTSRREEAAPASFDGNSSVGERGTREQDKLGEAGDTICARAQLLLCHVEQACFQLGQLTAGLWISCQCMQRLPLQSIVTVPPTATAQSEDAPARACEERSSVMRHPGVLPPSAATAHGAACISGVLGGSAFVVPTASKHETFLEVLQAEGGGERSPLQQQVEDVRRMNSSETKWKSIRNATQQGDAVAENPIDGPAGNRTRICTAGNTCDTQMLGNAFRATPHHAEPQTTFATFRDGHVSRPVAADAGARLKQFSDGEECENQILRQMHDRRVNCCVDRVLLFQQRKVCYRTLETNLQALSELISEQCKAVISFSLDRHTGRAYTSDSVQREQHVETSKRLLGLLLQSTSLFHSSVHAVGNRHCCGKKANCLPSLNTAGNAVHRLQQYQQQRENSKPRRLLLTSLRSRNSRRRNIYDRRGRTLQVTRLLGTSTHSNPRANCFVDGTLMRASGKVLLSLCGMLLNALCCCADAACALPCPQKAGRVDYSHKLQKVEVLQQTSPAGKLTLCGSGSALTATFSNSSACRSEKNCWNVLPRTIKRACVSGHHGRSGKQKTPISSGKERVGHLRETESCLARTEGQLYYLLLTLAERNTCFEEHRRLLPGMRERRHSPQRSTSCRRVSKQTARLREAAASIHQQALVVGSVVPQTKALQLTAVSTAERFPALDLHVLHPANGDSTAGNECRGQTSKETVTAASAAESSLSAGADGVSHQYYSPRSRIDSQATRVMHTGRHLCSSDDCTADTLLDPRMPRAFTRIMPRLLYPHRHVRLFPRLLQRVLCGSLTTCSHTRAGVSASSCAASPSARILAVPSSTGSLECDILCDSMKSGIFCSTKPHTTIPPERAELWAQFLAKRPLPVPCVSHSAAYTDGPPRSSIGDTPPHGVRVDEFVSLASYAVELPVSKHRQHIPHLSGLPGSSLSQLATLRLHSTTENAITATFDSSFHEFPDPFFDHSASQVYHPSPQMALGVELFDSGVSRRGLLLFHCGVDFSALPWTACLNLLADMTCRASSVPSALLQPDEYILSTFNATTGTTHGAVPHSLFVFPVAYTTRSTSNPGSRAAVTELGHVCASLMADFDLESPPNASCYAPPSSSSVALSTPLQHPTPRNDSYTVSFSESYIGRSETLSPTVHAKPFLFSNIPAAAAPEPTVSRQVQSLYVPPLLKMFNIKKWITALEKQQQHRILCNGSKCVLVARVAADLLLHTLQMHRTLEKCGRPRSDLQKTAHMALRSCRAPPQVASVKDPVASGGVPHVSAWTHLASNGSQPVALPVTNASIVFRLAAVSLLFASTRHGEGSVETTYQLGICMLASYLSSPLLVCGPQTALRCLGNHTQVHESLQRKTVPPANPWNTHLRRQNMDRPHPEGLTFASPNLVSLPTPGGYVSITQCIPFVKDYNHLTGLEGVVTRIYRAGASTHKTPDHNRETEAGTSEEMNQFGLKSWCSNTCCGHPPARRIFGRAAARRVSLQLLQDCIGRVPELLSALLPILLFCTPVHLFHQRLPSSLVRSLFLHVKQGQFVPSRTAFATSAFGAESASCPIPPSNISAFPGRKCATTADKSPRPAGDAFVPPVPRVAAAPISCTHLLDAAFHVVSPPPLPTGNIAASDGTKGPEFGGLAACQNQQRARTRHFKSGTAAEDWWKQLLTCVATGQCYSHFSEKPPLLQSVSLLHSGGSYKGNCLSLQDSVLLILQRLMALLPSLVGLHSRSRASSHRRYRNNYRHGFLKCSEGNQLRQSLHAVKRLLSRRRAAKRRRQSRTACALFRLLLLRAVDAALHKNGDEGHTQLAGNTVLRNSRSAVPSVNVSDRYQSTTKELELDPSGNDGEGKIQEFGRKYSILQNVDLLEGAEPTLSETGIPSMTSETHTTIKSAKTEEVARSSCTTAGKAPASLSAASSPPVTVETRNEQTAVAVVTEPDYTSSVPVKKPQKSPSELKIGSCVEPVYETTSSVAHEKGTFDSQFEKALSRLLVRAAVYTAAECTTSLRYKPYRRYKYSILSLREAHNSKIRNARRVPSMRNADCPFKASSSKSGQAGGSKVVLEVPTGQVSPCSTHITSVSLRRLMKWGALERLRWKNRCSLVTRPQAGSGDTRRETRRTARVSPVERRRQLSSCVGVLREVSTSVQQQLISTFVAFVARGLVKPWTKQVAHFIVATEELYAQDRSAGKKPNKVACRTERPQQEGQSHEEHALAEGYKLFRQATLQKSAKFMVDTQALRHCSRRTSERVTCARIQLSKNSTSFENHRLALKRSRNKKKAHKTHRTLCVGWHLLKSCLQAVKRLPSENQQSIIVCRALRCLSKSAARTPNLDCSTNKLLSPADRRGSSRISTTLGWCVPPRSEDRSTTSAAEISYLTQDATKRMPAATVKMNTLGKSLRISERRGTGTALMRAWCRRSALDSKLRPDAMVVTDTKSQVAPTSVTAPALYDPYAATSAKPALLQHTAIITRNRRHPVGSRSRAKREAANIAERQNSTRLLSGIISRKNGKAILVCVQRRSAKTVREVGKDCYHDAPCSVEARVQGPSVVGPKMGETTRCFVTDRTYEIEKRRALLRCELLLAALTPHNLVNKKEHFFSEASFSNEHFQQQVRSACSDEGKVIKERCRAAAALVLLCAPSLLPVEQGLPLKPAGTADPRKIQEPSNGIDSEGLPAGALLSQTPHHSIGREQRHEHASRKLNTHNEKKWEAKLGHLMRPHTNGHIGNTFGGGNKSADVGSFQPDGISLPNTRNAIRAPQQNSERAATPGHAMTTGRTVNTGDKATSLTVIRETTPIASSVEMSFDFTKDTPRFDADSSAGEDSMTDSFKERNSDPSPSSLFYLSSSSFSLCGTPQNPRKSSYAVPSRGKASQTKTEISPKVREVRSERSPTSSICEKDPLSLDGITRAHQFKNGFDVGGRVADGKRLPPESRGKIKTGTSGRAARVDERRRLPATYGVRRPVIAVGDSLLWWRSALRFKSQNYTNSGTRRRTTAHVGRRVGAARQHDSLALTPKRFGKILRPACVLSDELRVAVQIIERFSEEAVFHVGAHEQPSCDRHYTTLGIGTSQLSNVRAGYPKITDALLSRANHKQEKEVVACVTPSQAQSKAYKSSTAGLCTALLAGSFAVEGTAEYCSVYSECHRAPPVNSTDRGSITGISVTPFKNKKPEVCRNRLISVSPESAGASSARYPYGCTVSSSERATYLLCVGKSQETVVRGVPVTSWLWMNKPQHIFTVKGLQKPLYDAADICLSQEVAAKTRTQASCVRDGGKGLFIGFAGFLLRHPLTRRFLNCTSPSKAQQVQEHVVPGLNITLLTLKWSCPLLHPGRLQQNASLSIIDLYDHTNSGCIAQRYKQPVRPREEQLQRQSWKPSCIPSERILVKGETSTGNFAGKKDISCTFVGQHSHLASHAKRTICQSLYTSASGLNTVVRSRSHRPAGGVEGLKSVSKVGKKHSFQGLNKGLRDSHRGLKRKGLAVTRHVTSEKLVLSQKHLMAAAFLRRTPHRMPVVPHAFGVVTGKTLYLKRNKGHTLTKTCVHRFDGLLMKNLLNAAMIETIYLRGATHNSTACCRRQFPEQPSIPQEHTGDTSAFKKKFSHAILNARGWMASFKCAETVCSTSGCAGSVHELGKGGNKRPPLEHAEALQCKWELKLPDQHTAEVQKSAEVQCHSTNENNVKSKAKRVGPQSDALFEHVTETLRLHQYLRCDHSRSPRQKWVPMTGYCLNHSSSSASRSKEQDARQSEMTVHGAKLSTGTFPCLHSSVHDAKSPMTVPAVADGEINVEIEQLTKRAKSTSESYPTALAATLCVGCAARQLHFGEATVVSPPHSPGAAGIGRHTSSPTVEKYVLWLRNSDAAKMTSFDDSVSNDSPLPCEECKGEFDNETMINGNSYNFDSTMPATMGPSGLSEERVWTEIESAVYSSHRNEGAKNSPNSDGLQMSRGNPNAVDNEQTDKRHVCRIRRDNDISLATSPPLIRCVSTLFDSQPSQGARRPSADVQPTSLPQRTRSRAETEKMFQSTIGSPPYCRGKLELLKPLESAQRVATTTLVQGLISTCRCNCAPGAVFLRRRRTSYGGSSEDGTTLRFNACSASRTSSTSNRRRRITRSCSAVVRGRTLCRARAHLSVRSYNNDDVMLKIKVRCT